MPRVSTVEELDRAVAGFAVADLELDIDPPALAAARLSLAESGFLLLGEVHGVRENPLVIRSLMRVLRLTGLALEWHADLAPPITEFLAGGRLLDHPLLWTGDGRPGCASSAATWPWTCPRPRKRSFPSGPCQGRPHRTSDSCHPHAFPFR